MLSKYRSSKALSVVSFTPPARHRWQIIGFFFWTSERLITAHTLSIYLNQLLKKEDFFYGESRLYQRSADEMSKNLRGNG